MSTAFFGVKAGAAAVLSGSFSADGASTSFSGHNLKQSLGNQSQVDVVLTGTSAATNIFGTWDVSVAGGSFSSIGSDGTLTTGASLFSGLTDTAHTVCLRARSANYIDQDATDATHCSFAVTGATPAASAPASLSTPTAGTNVPSGTQYPVSGAAYISCDGDVALSQSNSGYTLNTYGHPNAALRFRAKCTSVALWCFGSVVNLELFRDGVSQGNFAVSATGAFGWNGGIAGLIDDGAYHDYELVDGTAANGAGTLAYIYSLMVAGGAAIMDTSYAPAVRKKFISYGDSITSLTNGGFSNALVGYTHKEHSILNVATVSDGVGGSQMTGPDANAGVNRTANIRSLTPLDYLYIEFGTNDVANGVSIGDAATSGTFTGDYKTCLNTFLSDIPGTAKIYCQGVIPQAAKTWAQIQVYNAAIQTAIAACSSPSRVTYVDPAPWQLAGAAYNTGGSFDPTLYNDATVHPNDAGHTIIANGVAQIIAPSSNAALLGAGFFL